MMRAILNSQFVPQQFEEEALPRLDLSEAFPLNKLGNFGRELERKCRLTEKGVMEFEDSKPPKLKEIKTFANRIEAFGEKGVDSKIGWISEDKKYPFRIIVVDKSDGHKGIYFASQQKAEQVRVFLAQNLRYTGNFPRLLAVLNKRLAEETAEAFRGKLVLRKKMISKSNRFSRNVVEDKSRVLAESQVRQPHEPQNSSVFFNEGISASNKGNESSGGDMLRLTKLLETRNSQEALRPQKVRELQSAYVVNFLEVWHDKARAVRLSEKKRQEQRGVNPNILATGSRILNDNERKSALAGSHNDSPKREYGRERDNESIFKALEGSSIKESYVKEFSRELGAAEELSCYSIEFLTLSNLFFKPIVTVELQRKGRVEHSAIYNTVILRKEPHLAYQLLPSEDESLPLSGSLREYDIAVKVIDFLANEEVLSDKISMRAKKVLEKAVLSSDNRTLQLELGVQVNEVAESGAKAEGRAGVAELSVPALSEEARLKISAFWEKQSQSQGYYNESNLSVYKILSQIEAPPLSWWKGLSEDDLELYQVFSNAARILGFRMARSFTHIIRAFELIFPDLEEMVVKALSFLVTFMRPYYFPEHFNKIQRFHRAIGLEEDCEFISKVSLEVIAIEKIVGFECPTLTDKLARKNIAYGYQLMEYIYEAFSRNFSPACLVELWNHLSGELELLQLSMVLVAIALVKYYEEDLMKAKRFSDFRLILESQRVAKAQHVIKEVTALRQRYFGEVKGGFLDEIKSIFNSKPLEPILVEFYKRETAKIDRRKGGKEIEKKSVLRKVNKQVEVELPLYENKKYCLHICFRRLPSVGGSLTLRSNEVDYECLNHEKSRYFIIGEVSSRVTLLFLDLKSNEFSCELVFNQGVNEHTATLSSPRSASTHRVTYLAALLTDNQLEVFRKGKKFDHFLSPFVRQLDFFEEMNRPVQEADFLKRYDNSGSRDDLVKKIKVLFCSGTRTFNEVDFYLEQIETSDLTIEEKLWLVKSFAAQLSSEFALCRNQAYEKHFFKLFLEKTGFQFDDAQFECFYSDSLENEFDSPKVIKCRYVPLNQPHKELKLEAETLAYFIGRGARFLYADLVVEELINALKGPIVEQLGVLLEGELKLLFSSNGEIYVKTWVVRPKNKNKEVEYEEIKEDTVDDLEEAEISEPEILMTEVLPSFAKISTILDYVNTNRNIDLKTKYQDKDRKKIVDCINVLKDCQARLAKVIPMRNRSYPQDVHVPFFLYYYELVRDFSTPNIKPIYLNNLKTDLRSLCLLKGTVKFGENAKV